MEKEIWKDIYFYDFRTNTTYDYRGMYQVSNYGKVRSVDRIDNRGELRKGKQLKERHKSKKSKEKYLSVVLCKDGKEKSFSIHRLVAYMFIPNPNNFLEVNHKDENQENNHVDNLEWCNNDYNRLYGTRTKRAGESQRGNKHSKATPIVQYNNKKEIVKVWSYIKEVLETTGINNVSACCRGVQKTAGKDKNGNPYYWKYLHDVDDGDIFKYIINNMYVSTDAQRS